MRYEEALEAMKEHEFSVIRSSLWEKREYMYYVNSSSIDAVSLRGSASKAFSDLNEREKVRIIARYDKREGKNIIVNYTPNQEEIASDWECIIIESVPRNGKIMDSSAELMDKMVDRMDNIELLLRKIDIRTLKDDRFYHGKFNGRYRKEKEYVMEELHYALSRQLAFIDDEIMEKTAVKQITPLILINTLIEYRMVYGNGENLTTNALMQILSDGEKVSKNIHSQITTTAEMTRYILEGIMSKFENISAHNEPSKKVENTSDELEKELDDRSDKKEKHRIFNLFKKKIENRE